jgi:hypothetical protein
MNDKRVATVEMQELMLSSPFDAFDAFAFHGARSSGRKFLPEGGMNCPHGGDGLSKRGAG